MLVLIIWDRLLLWFVKGDESAFTFVDFVNYCRYLLCFEISFKVG